MTGAEDVIRQLVARFGDAADFHFAPKYVDCIVEEYVGKIAGLDDGTCHVTKRTAGCFDGTRYNEWTFEFSCGHWYRGGSPFPPSFCCHCGRRIEVDE